VQDIVKKTGTSIEQLIGKSQLLRNLKVTDYTNEKFGLPTVLDILQELEKPGRDPRPEFKSVTFKAGIEKITDLREGMQLEGVVTNVANFGAFVDIGVHQDGLVHISHLADVFIKDPRDVVKTGDAVNVKVIEIDIARKRIALSMKKEAITNNPTKTDTAPQRKAYKSTKPTEKSQGSMANAFAQALKK